MKSPSRADNFEPFVAQMRQTEFSTFLPQSAKMDFRDIVEAQVVPDVSVSIHKKSEVISAPSLADDHAQELESLKRHLAETQTQLVTAEKNCEARVEALRCSLSIQLADQFLSHVQREMQQVEARLEKAINDVLAPFVEETVRDKILSSFVQEIASLLGSGRMASTQIKAPAGIHSLLVEKFRRAGIEIQIQSSETPEITIELNGSVVSTRLAFWSGLLVNGAT